MMIRELKECTLSPEISGFARSVQGTFYGRQAEWERRKMERVSVA
jgi:hypothetical protein